MFITHSIKQKDLYSRLVGWGMQVCSFSLVMTKGKY